MRRRRTYYDPRSYDRHSPPAPRPAILRTEGPIPSPADREGWVRVWEDVYNAREGCALSRIERAPSGALYLYEATFLGWQCVPVITEE